jgi:hypothetical protein
VNRDCALAVVMGIASTIGIGAAWMRWWDGELPPWTSVAFLTFCTACYACRCVADAWRSR